MSAKHFMILGILSFSGVEALVKCVSMTLTGAELLVVRSLFILPIIGIFLAMRTTQGLASYKPLPQIVRSVMGLGSMVCTIESLKILPLPDFTFLFFLSPVFGTGLARVFLGEPFSFQALIATLLGCAGVYILVNPSATDMLAWQGYAWALAAAMCFGSATVLAKKADPRDDDYVFVTYYTLACLVYGLVVMLYTGRAGTSSTHLSLQTAWSYNVVFMVAAMALLNMLGNVFVVKAVRDTDVMTLLPFKYLSLPAALVWGYVFWGYLPGLRSLLGAGVIVLATLVNWGVLSWQRLRPQMTQE